MKLLGNTFAHITSPGKGNNFESYKLVAENSQYSGLHGFASEN